MVLIRGEVKQSKHTGKILADADPENADWTKFRWGDLPPYKSPEFMTQLRALGISLEQFRTMPVYKMAVRRGLIKDDEWARNASVRRSMRECAQRAPGGCDVAAPRLPYGTGDLRERRIVSETAVTCHVSGCATTVARQRRFFRASEEFLCREHGIYLSPTTFQYADPTRNLLWRYADDCRLLASIAKTKRTTARLGRECDEDALTWNVVRAFHREGRLGRLLEIVLAGRCKPPAGEEPEIIYWGAQGGRLWPCLATAREEFGEPVRAGTEPDLALWWPGKLLVFVEVKFRAGNKTQPSEMQDGPDHRPCAYCKNGHFERVFGADYNQVAVESAKYELMRNWLLGSWIAMQSGAAFALVNLVRSGAECDIETKFGHDLCREQPDRVFVRSTWESIWAALPSARLSDETARTLDAYFQTKSVGYDHKGGLQKAFTRERVRTCRASP